MISLECSTKAHVVLHRIYPYYDKEISRYANYWQTNASFNERHCVFLSTYVPDISTDIAIDQRLTTAGTDIDHNWRFDINK